MREEMQTANQEIERLQKRLSWWSTRIERATVTIPAGHYEQLLIVIARLALALEKPTTCILTENIVDELRQALAELARD